MQRKKTFSRRINYAAVEKLFEKPSSSSKGKGKSIAPSSEGGGQDDDVEDNEKYDDDKFDDTMDHGGEMDEYMDDGYQEEI